MGNQRHLIRRGNRWHYNRAYPLDVQEKLGAAPFRRSLRTDSLAEAQRARPEAERQYWATVDAARVTGQRGGAAPLKPADEVSLAVHWFREAIAEQEDWVGEAYAPDELEQAVGGKSQELGDLRRELAEEGGGLDAWRIAREVAEAAGFAATKGLARLIQRARIAKAEIFFARALGDYGERPSDPLFAAALADVVPVAAPAVTQVAPKRTIEDLEAAFRADRWDNIKPASQASYALVIRFLKDVLGARREVEGLTRDDGRRLFEAAKALPAGYGKGKQWEGLDTLAAIERGKREGLATILPKTINGTYMGLLASLFGWAVREGWLPLNPVSTLKVRDPVLPRDKRDAFTPDQLLAIFGGSPWRPRDDSPRGHPVRYWMPLIALYQGMRRGEIAQLRPQYFHVEDGIPLFEVRGDLKNENARRLLPVHPELARLGFLDFVERRRKAGAAGLFHDQHPDKQGKWGDAAGDWFSRHIKSLELKGVRLGLHSLRHNFEDALRRAELHGTPIGAALAGRKGASAIARASV
ncbi:DUF6538 domain-containing protein [Novosphingobium tardum]|uniref:DUF6538 domain-containing protein n=1 Tax=Novosphingobium tardum TaxID=1538021 RepID=A0ABV8RLS1_9SPHN